MATFKKRGKKWTVMFDIPGSEKRSQKRLSGFDSRQDANLAHIVFLANYKPLANKPPVKKDFIDKPVPVDKAQVDKIPQNHTLDSAHKSYLDYKRHNVKESTYAAIEANYRSQIKPYLGEMIMSEIKAIDIVNWHIKLNERNLCYQTKKKTHTFLSQFFNYCVTFELLEINPCKKAGAFKNTEIKKEMLIWSEKEFMSFISGVDDLLYKSFFSFLYLTGVRRGEALALTWNDIVGNIAKINKTLGYHAIKGGFIITTPKNQYSNREIVLPKNLVGLLAQLKSYYEKFELFNSTNYVFGNIRPLPPETIRRKLKDYCKATDIKVIRIHDFRHSHASLLISKGHDIVTIARRLGHSDIEMTLNRYAHLMPNKQLKLMSSLNIHLSV